MENKEEKLKEELAKRDEIIAKKDEEIKKLLLAGGNKLYSKICSDHKNKKIKGFCETCENFSCSKCTEKHKNHSYSVKEFGISNLNDYCCYSINSLNAIKNFHEKTKTNIRKETDRKIALLNKNANLEITEIEKKIEEINTQIKRINEMNDYFYQTDSLQLKLKCKEIEGLLKNHLNLIDKDQFDKINLFNRLEMMNKLKLDSKIITDQETARKLMELLPEGTEFRLIYRGSTHSMKASAFHKNCDNQGPTFTIIQSKEKGKIFGGYTDISITSSYQYK